MFCLLKTYLLLASTNHPTLTIGILFRNLVIYLIVFLYATHTYIFMSNDHSSIRCVLPRYNICNCMFKSAIRQRGLVPIEEVSTHFSIDHPSSLIEFLITNSHINIIIDTSFSLLGHRDIIFCSYRCDLGMVEPGTSSFRNY